MSELEAADRSQHRSARVEVLNYGQDPEQHVELSISARAVRGLIFLVHGGYWRSKFSASLMTGVRDLLVADGWAVANIEYRRTGTGGEWPVACNDVRAAIEYVRKADVLGDIEVAVAIGHSAGGQLGLLAGDLLDGVVALAPVTDMRRTEREELGEGAALEFMQRRSIDDPHAYDSASPLLNVLSRRILLIHGDIDERVPVEHSRDYATAMKEAGASIDYIELEGVTHHPLIDTTQPHWPAILEWLDDSPRTESLDTA
ncbi:alpha/beta fold hydrolase [Nocardia sp. NBC_00565]|uniref:alpha/beta hydrolase family protein n=1 Tax=Nocardia sp. NBC_00565 TaxID=2975993 RepID=UPI002E81222D|nr:alpha/beta fold hydrolase [Nocardia sp. NBC_00565]WUC06626.1 alpha/beta fold hydrolase [Nocardia sp. NBC_00565]